MKRLLLPLLALIVLSAGLTGCGQKGPLYLPGDKSAGNSKDRFEL
jgi:predicted small lipoprotein YifL